MKYSYTLYSNIRKMFGIMAQKCYQRFIMSYPYYVSSKHLFTFILLLCVCEMCRYVIQNDCSIFFVTYLHRWSFLYSYKHKRRYTYIHEIKIYRIEFLYPLYQNKQSYNYIVQQYLQVSSTNFQFKLVIFKTNTQIFDVKLLKSI